MDVITAQLNYAHISPRKARLVTDALRGLSVAEAAVRLQIIEKKAARYLAKLLASAMASAKQHNIDAAVLRVQSITVNGGPILKRSVPRAHGRATPIRHRTSHISLVLHKAS